MNTVETSDQIGALLILAATLVPAVAWAVHVAIDVLRGWCSQACADDAAQAMFEARLAVAA